MRELTRYSAAEWLRLVPVSEGIRQVRNDLLLGVYLKAEPQGLAEFLRSNASLAGRDVAIVIAFQQPWTLQWLLQAAKRNLPGVTVLVFDNSREDGKREEIAAVCAREGAPYLALPPYRTRHVNRSHGMAMSWIYQRVVRALQPRIFGYLDHDLIPMRPVDLSQRLQGQAAYGLPNIGRDGNWSIWAGYCFYWFDQVRGRALNYLYDFSRGLDTGGRNWSPLYRHLDRSRMRFAPQQFVDITLAPGVQRKVEIVDDSWIHMGGVGYNDNFESKFAFFEQLRLAVARGRRWEDLLPA
jgi:hypothetical protein